MDKYFESLTTAPNLMNDWRCCCICVKLNLLHTKKGINYLGGLKASKMPAASSLAKLYLLSTIEAA